jgi:hypothetical protein
MAPWAPPQEGPDVGQGSTRLRGQGSRRQGMEGRSLHRHGDAGDEAVKRIDLPPEGFHGIPGRRDARDSLAAGPFGLRSRISPVTGPKRRERGGGSTATRGCSTSTDATRFPGKMRSRAVLHSPRNRCREPRPPRTDFESDGDLTGFAAAVPTSHPIEVQKGGAVGVQRTPRAGRCRNAGDFQGGSRVTPKPPGSLPDPGNHTASSCMVGLRPRSSRKRPGNGVHPLPRPPGPPPGGPLLPAGRRNPGPPDHPRHPRPGARRATARNGPSRRVLPPALPGGLPRSPAGPSSPSSGWASSPCPEREGCDLDRVDAPSPEDHPRGCSTHHDVPGLQFQGRAPCQVQRVQSETLRAQQVEASQADRRNVSFPGQTVTWRRTMPSRNVGPRTRIAASTRAITSTGASRMRRCFWRGQELTWPGRNRRWCGGPGDQPTMTPKTATPPAIHRPVFHFRQLVDLGRLPEYRDVQDVVPGRRRPAGTRTGGS